MAGEASPTPHRRGAGRTILAVAIDPDPLIAFAQELVRIPSVHDPATGRREEPAALAVAAKMREFGWEPLIEEVAPGRPNVIAVVDSGRPGPTLMFEGHTDVVTEGETSSWTVDPYGAEIINGRLYGRGAADMKGGVAAMLYAAQAVASGPFCGRLLIGALVDEEGMMLGAKHFAARHGADVDAAICCEPEAGEVCNASKGALRLRVQFTGKMAHGAMPHEARNPNPALAAFLGALAGHQTDLQRAHPAHPLLGEVYLTPTAIRAGAPEHMNVIPGDAALWLDVRTIPGVLHHAVVERLDAAATAAGEPWGISAAVEVIDDRPAVETPADSALVRALLGAHEAVTGEAALLGGVPGSTDGTILTARAGIPTVVYGPGGKWIAHQADEFVELDDVVRCAEVYVETARRFLGAG
jgi:succinyl-diaminopimelate desuccinylase